MRLPEVSADRLAMSLFAPLCAAYVLTQLIRAAKFALTCVPSAVTPLMNVKGTLAQIVAAPTTLE
jgi:hypothetical protein